MLLSCKVKSHQGWIRSESESEQGEKYGEADAKPSDLSMARMKRG